MGKKLLNNLKEYCFPKLNHVSFLTEGSPKGIVHYMEERPPTHCQKSHYSEKMLNTLVKQYLYKPKTTKSCKHIKCSRYLWSAGTCVVVVLRS